MSGRGEKGPSQRMLRVGEEIRHALSMVLERGDLRDPALQATSITVTEVRPSPDLRHVTAYIMPLGGDDREAVLEGLNRARPYLRRIISSTMSLRYSPDIHFRLDETFDEADHISQLLLAPHVAQDLDRFKPVNFDDDVEEADEANTDSDEDTA